MERKNEMKLQCLHGKHDEALCNVKVDKLKAKKHKRKGVSGILKEKLNHLAAKCKVDFEDLEPDDDPYLAKRIKEDQRESKSEFNLRREKKVSTEYFGMALNGIHRQLDKAYPNKIAWNEFS